MTPINVILYTREGCGLCDEVKAELEVLGQSFPLRLQEIDIRQDPALEEALSNRIPVIEIQGNRLESPIDSSALRAALVRAVVQTGRTLSSLGTKSGGADLQPQPASDAPSDYPKATGRKREIIIALDKLFLQFARHWVAVLTLLAGIYVGLPFAAPVAMHFGWTGAGRVIYTVYNTVCHQLAFRSWFLFGAQPYYPRALAGLPVGTFEQYASQEPAFQGVDPYTLDARLYVVARAFPGSERMGWKVALCQRDVGIYAAIVLFGLLYILLKRIGVKVPYLPFWAYILFAIVPLGLDGFSQLLANPPFNGLGLAFYPIRESTPLLRTLTGALFGAGNAWLAYPYLDDSMQETIALITAKLSRAGVLKTAEAPQAAD
jgi:uncharacterized membrane protein